MATVPEAPEPVTFAVITQKWVDVVIKPKGTGGSPILEYQIDYGLTNHTKTTTITSDGTTRVDGLNIAATYYFWARARNEVGWGPYSPVRGVQLHAGALVKVGGEWKRAIPFVRTGGVWKIARPWTMSMGVWKMSK